MDKNMQTNYRKYIFWVIAVLVIAVLSTGAYLSSRNSLSNATPNGAAKIEITNCNSISPQTTSVTIGQPIVFDNDDGVSHTIFIGGVSLDLSAGSSLAINSRLPYGIGAYGYTCDDELTPNQIIVTNQ